MNWFFESKRFLLSLAVGLTLIALFLTVVAVLFIRKEFPFEDNSDSNVPLERQRRSSGIDPGDACKPGVLPDLPSDWGPKTDSRRKPDPGLFVAFVGDTGIDDPGKEVLRLIRDEGVDLAVHLGDFVYDSDPNSFADTIDSELGSIPFLANVGNHDVEDDTKVTSKYIDYLNSRMLDANMKGCSGRPGIQTVCNYRGLLLVNSVIGTACDSDEQNQFIKLSLRNQKRFQWKICVWHKDQHVLQVGDKSDEVGWKAYNLCKRYGALIITAHDHNYARSAIFSDVDSQVVATDQVIKNGQTAVLLTGLGGHSVAPVDSSLEKKILLGKCLHKRSTC